jgi:hypothetical protein
MSNCEISLVEGKDYILTIVEEAALFVPLNSNAATIFVEDTLEYIRKHDTEIV